MNNTTKIAGFALAAPLLALAVIAAGKPAATTLENLQTAFNVETNAKARYEAFAGKAAEEGYAGVAGLFRAVSVSEGIHAANHAGAIRALGGTPSSEVKLPPVKTTKANLKEAIRTEKNESGKIYPAYVKQAIAENDPRAVMSLKGAMASEAGHARLFSMALEKLAEWTAQVAIIVCRTCGYTTNDLNIKFCPFCTQPRAQFMEVK